MVAAGECEHEHDEPARDEHRARHVEALDARVAALVEQDRREDEPRHSDRNVDEEDPLPAEQVGQHAAEQHAGDGAERADRTPRAECGVPLLALRERRAEDRECCGRDHRGAEPLQRARADQRGLAPGEPGEERRSREDDQPGDEHAPTADDVGDPPAEQEEASEEERVGAHDPLEALPREPEVGLDGRKGDVHDRDVEHDHELHAEEQSECEPLPSSRCDHGASFRLVRRDLPTYRTRLQKAIFHLREESFDATIGTCPSTTTSTAPWPMRSRWSGSGGRC